MWEDRGLGFGAGGTARERSLADLRETVCLVLLGEPGLGKTTALRAERDDLRGCLPSGDGLLHVDLGGTREEQVLRRRIFEADEFRRWSQGTGVLHLLLDSFDEARVRVEVVAGLLMEGLEGADFERLRLRLACRSADRHRLLEDWLRERSVGNRPDGGGFGAFSLLPLRFGEVFELAREAGVDPGSFTREISARGIGPLASRPLLLGLLLRTFREGSGLPESVAELYRRGCRLLAQEPDEDRRAGSAAGRLAPSERVALARRIAAATILSGRSAIVLDADVPRSSDDIELDELAGGREMSDTAVTTTFSVDDRALRETLGTALFSEGGERRMSFAHKTFAEFLAARYLATHMRPSQMLDLLTVREGSARRVVPQLREVAAWLVGVPELVRELLPLDVDVLLRAGDLSVLDDMQRAAAVQALLDGAASGMSLHMDERAKTSLAGLVHPDIDQQLGAVLIDETAQSRTRELAADLAGACRRDPLAPRLLDVAFDEHASRSVRTAAVGALAGGWARRELIMRLVPLAFEQSEAEPDEWIRAAAFRALWPHALGAGQLFHLLSEPLRTGGYHSSYSMFVEHEVMAYLNDVDLPVALRWATEQPRESDIASYPLAMLVQQILLRACELHRDPCVFAGLVELVLTFLKGRFDLLDDEHREVLIDRLIDREGARALVSALVPRVADGSLQAASVIRSRPRLLDRQDLGWLVEKLESSLEGPWEAGWARLIAVKADPGDAQTIMEARAYSATLRALTAEQFDAVALDSPRAVEARRAQARERHAESANEKLLVEEANATIEAAQKDLELFEAGETAAFWRLNTALVVDAGYFEWDLTKTRGWRLLEPSTRERVVCAAERYLSEADPQPEQWFGQHRVHEPAWAGYRALCLLSEHAPERLQLLGPSIWARWTPIVMVWPIFLDDLHANARLVGACFSAAADAALTWFLAALDADMAKPACLEQLERARDVDLSILEAPLLERATDDECSHETRAAILESLVAKGSQRAREVAEALLRLPEQPQQQALAVEVAQLLIDATPATGWPLLWKLMQSHPKLGRTIVERLELASWRDVQGAETEAGRHLDELQLAGLLAWLEEQYPSAEDPVDAFDLFGSARSEVAAWRAALARELAGKGTDAAVRQLDRLHSILPSRQAPALRREARELARAARWTPPPPAAVVQMGADVARRWVTSDAELRETIVESLARADEVLQAAAPAAVDLWDPARRNPMHEPDLSNWLERWLKNDLRRLGVTVGRDTQVRPGKPGKMGAAGDLVVEAIASEHTEAPERALVIVEVKGAWNRELDRAMRGQLAERYLLPAGHRDGVYVVGWFAAEDWDPRDWRRARCARRDLRESRDYFSRQAEQVSAQCAVAIDAIVLDCSLPAERARR